MRRTPRLLGGIARAVQQRTSPSPHAGAARTRAIGAPMSRAQAVKLAICGGALRSSAVPSLIFGRGPQIVVLARRPCFRYTFRANSQAKVRSLSDGWVLISYLRSGHGLANLYAEGASLDLFRSYSSCLTAWKTVFEGDTIAARTPSASFTPRHPADRRLKTSKKSALDITGMPFARLYEVSHTDPAECAGRRHRHLLCGRVRLISKRADTLAV